MEKQLVDIGGELHLRKQIQDQHNGLPLKVQELVDPHETPTANHPDMILSFKPVCILLTVPQIVSRPSQSLTFPDCKDLKGCASEGLKQQHI